MIDDSEHERRLYSDDAGLNWPSTIIQRPALSSQEFAALTAFVNRSPERSPATAYFSRAFTCLAQARAMTFGAPKHLMPPITVKIVRCTASEFQAEYTVYEPSQRQLISRLIKLPSLESVVQALNSIVVGNSDNCLDYSKEMTRIRELLVGLVSDHSNSRSNGRS